MSYFAENRKELVFRQRNKLLNRSVSGQDNYLLDVEIDGRQHRYEDRRLYIYQTRKLETRK